MGDNERGSTNEIAVVSAILTQSKLTNDENGVEDAEEDPSGVETWFQARKRIGGKQRDRCADTAAC